MAVVRNYTEAFEPEAEKALSPEHAALVSMAISLKRIADVLNGNDTWALNALMENAGQAFSLGMRGR